MSNEFAWPLRRSCPKAKPKLHYPWICTALKLSPELRKNDEIPILPLQKTCPVQCTSLMELKIMWRYVRVQNKIKIKVLSSVYDVIDWKWSSTLACSTSHWGSLWSIQCSYWEIWTALNQAIDDNLLGRIVGGRNVRSRNRFTSTSEQEL